MDRVNLKCSTATLLAMAQKEKEGTLKISITFCHPLIVQLLLAAACPMTVAAWLDAAHHCITALPGMPLMCAPFCVTHMHVEMSVNMLQLLYAEPAYQLEVLPQTLDRNRCFPYRWLLPTWMVAACLRGPPSNL